MQRIPITDEQSEELYDIALKTKIDWYATDYYFKNRKTVDVEDLQALQYNADNLSLNYSDAIKELFNKANA